jgi:uncharacterized PurR-regulated membrane protein YhhQ (DUF165 family)
MSDDKQLTFAGSFNFMLLFVVPEIYGRKPLRQAVYEGFISLSLSDKSIILCFYAFGRLRKYAGSFRFLRQF